MNRSQNRRSYARAGAFAAVAFGAIAIACSTRVSSDLTAPTPISASKAAGLPAGQQAYFEFQVEKPVARQGAFVAPKYPDILKQAGVEGEVLVQYVVDETGAIMPGTMKVLKSTHQLFAEAVRNALPEMKFTPAEVGGRKVKQLVQHPFVFALAGPRESREIMRADSGGAGGKGPRILTPTTVTPVKRP